MADCEWLILCDTAFQGEHRKLSLIGIFNTIFAQAVPAAQLKSAVGFGLVGEPGENVRASLEILSPNGTVIFGAGLTIRLADEGSGSFPVEFPPLHLPEFGQYVIQLDLHNGQPPTTAWFAIKQLPER